MHPSREVNGSGRVLYHEWTTERDYTTALGAALYPTRRVPGPVCAGLILEWAPSGNYLRIDSTWYHTSAVEVLEVLGPGPA